MGFKSRQADELNAKGDSCDSSYSLHANAVRLMIGGSWKKSPTKITCSPPNGVATPFTARNT
ncbi:MAG: hypothetical protein JW384_03575 [Nitrosomonadaceae bacterium]|nr:hypothetical protein [Nitrosomonadaceae bacterium]